MDGSRLGFYVTTQVYIHSIQMKVSSFYYYELSPMGKIVLLNDVSKENTSDTIQNRSCMKAV